MSSQMGTDDFEDGESSTGGSWRLKPQVSADIIGMFRKLNPIYGSLNTNAMTWAAVSRKDGASYRIVRGIALDFIVLMEDMIGSNFAHEADKVHLKIAKGLAEKYAPVIEHNRFEELIERC
jgi:hypothetical protein